MKRLEALELEEEDTRRPPGAPRKPAAGPADPLMARLDDVEAALGEDEALLSFMIGLQEELAGDFGGGAWLTVSTRHGTTVHRVPDRVRLQAIVPVFLGLFEARDGRDAAAAASLYQELLAPALAGLPESITRLVVIPDDALHQVPFAALRKAAGQEPLVSRYEIAIAPSATLWLRWRKTSDGASPHARHSSSPIRTLDAGARGWARSLTRGRRAGRSCGACAMAASCGWARTRRSTRSRRRPWLSSASCTSPRTPWWTTSGRSAPPCSWRPGATAKTGSCSYAR